MKMYVITRTEKYEYRHQNEWGGYDKRPDEAFSFCYAITATANKEKAIDEVKREETDRESIEKDNYEKLSDYEEESETLEKEKKWCYSRYVLLEKEYFDDNECGICDKESKDDCEECYWNKPTKEYKRITVRATEVEMK